MDNPDIATTPGAVVERPAARPLSFLASILHARELVMALATGMDADVPAA